MSMDFAHFSDSMKPFHSSGYDKTRPLSVSGSGLRSIDQLKDNAVAVELFIQGGATLQFSMIPMIS